MLVVVETRNANPDGTSPDWAYVFDSPKAKKQVAIFVEAAGTVSRFETSAVYKEPVGDFVDSDKAMAEAIRNGLKTHGFGMTIRLDAHNRSKRAEWRMLDETFFYYVDAKNGRFLRKERTDK